MKAFKERIKKMEDNEIVDLLWERSETAISEAQRKYADYCSYIANNLLRDPMDVEECLNDALLSLWKSIPPQRPANLKTYLGKLTRNAAVDILRKQRAQKRFSCSTSQIDEIEEMIGENDVESSFREQELSSLITSFLHSIREDDRNIFVRRYWFFDSVKKIAETYGFGQSKVLVSLKRSRDKLASLLKEKGYLE